MRHAGIAELKASLSEYLAAVKSGEEVIVTERGNPIARITPVAPSHAESRSTEKLVRAGVLRPPERGFSEDFFHIARARDPDGAVLKALLKEREESR